MRLRPFAVILLSTLLLSACGGGMVRRVSDPAASVQQLTVNLDGSWTLELRLQNYSSIPMRYDRLRLQLGVDGQDAGTVEAAPAISIGPESADVLSVPLRPASG
ncbi:LEA type 2 family protein, partial [Xanthomonas sp. Kuri4-3]